jgi:hypothetical protein
VADTKTLLGKFLSERYKNLDTPQDPFKPLTESFVNIDLPDADLRLRALKTAELQKVGEFPRSASPSGPVKVDEPSLSREPGAPRDIGELPRTSPAARQPSPTIPLTSPAARQPSLPTTPARPPADPIDVSVVLARPPAGPIDVAEPPRTSPAALQPSLPVQLSPAPAAARPGTPPAATRPAAQQPSTPTPKASGPADPVPGEVPAPTQPATIQVPLTIAPAPLLVPSDPLQGLRDSGFNLNPTLHVNDPSIERQLGSNPSTPPQLDNKDFSRRLQSVDAALFKYLKTVGDGSTTSIITEFGNPEGTPYAPVVGGPFGMAGGQSWNPILFAKNVVRLGVHLKLGLLTFGAIQVGLHLLNKTQEVGPRVSIWNPLVLANPPLLQNFIPNTINQLPLVANFTHENQVIKEGKDRHKAIAEGNHTEPFQITHNPPFFIPPQEVGKMLGPIGDAFAFFFPRLVGAKSQDNSILESSSSPLDIGKSLIQEGLKVRNFFTDENPSSKKSVVQIKDLVDEALDQKKVILVEDTIGGVKRYKFPSIKESPDPGSMLSGLFMNVKGATLSYPHEWRPKSDVVKDKGKEMVVGELEKSAFPRGIIPVKFNADNDQGFVTHIRSSSPSTEITDDEAYVPLSFTDLRPISGDKLRTIFFRPFITDFREEFHPDWNKNHYFGRTDYVATYQSVGRTIHISFSIHAFGPEDLKVIYSKLNWLTSMVYPQYDSNLAYVAGPVIRLRIGDVISSEIGFGIPGIIENLSFDYGGSLWEIKEKYKVPRSVKVSLSFIVLHDRPIGIGGGGRFGGIGSIDDDGNYNPPSADDTNLPPGSKYKFPKVDDSAAGGFRAFPDDLNDFE